jgi:hypothetical protein
MNVRVWQESAVWVVRVEDAANDEPVQEYADRALPVAFAMAERVHGSEIVDALAVKMMKENAA